MSAPASPAPASPAPDAATSAAGAARSSRPRRSALLASVGALALLALVFMGLYVRGTRVSTTPLDPREPTTRPLRQLGAGREGPRIEAALVVEHPLEATWAIVTDYARFGELFQPPLWTLRVDEVAALAGGARHRLRGAATSRLWSFPIDVTLEHATLDDGARTASWDTGEQRLAGVVNRGRWVLRALGPSRTQVLYEAEVRAPGYPAFLVNDLLLAEVGYVLVAVRDRLDRR